MTAAGCSGQRCEADDVTKYASRGVTTPAREPSLIRLTLHAFSQSPRSMTPRPEPLDADASAAKACAESRAESRDPAQVAAQRILSHLAAVYQPTHEYVPADPKAFRHLDVRWYDRTAEVLEARGFRRFADLEDKTITNAPNTVLRPTFLRAMVSRDGTVTGALYDPRLRGLVFRVLLWLLRKLPGKVTDFETELSDGTFIATSNAMAASTIGLPPSIHAAWLPMQTQPLTVYATHTARVQAYLSAHPGVSPVIIESTEAMLQSQDRQNALKAAFRGEIPGLTPDELKQLSLFGDGQVDAVHAAMEQERARRSA